MERGATLLLDEVDLASNKIMCQPVLEGNPLLIKKEGRIVRPAPGFTVMDSKTPKVKVLKMVGSLELTFSTKLIP